MLVNILMIHNYYKQRGGEDVSTESEVTLLKENGHHVEFYSVHNDLVDELGWLRSAFRSIWSCQSYREIKYLLKNDLFDVVHVQNFFPLISPSVYFAAKACGVPVVQSIRNYRLFCLNAFFFTDGKICERCLGSIFSWPGIKRKCYRNSSFASLNVALIQLVHHQILKTWSSKVSRFIALSDFVRQKLIESGLPESRITVKPNFVTPDPGPGNHDLHQFVFVGRLSSEKGIRTLINAWKLLFEQGRLKGYRLKVIGDGPEKEAMEAHASQLPVEFSGRMSSEETLEELGRSRCLVFPSEWYETFGRVAIEAYAKGIPVIASGIGAVQELVREERTGLLFEPGNVAALAEKIELIISQPETAKAMGNYAREVYLEHYSPKSNILMMEALYQSVISK